jgi:hypothetical protein
VSVIVITESPLANKLVERLIDCHPLLCDRHIERREAESRYATSSKARTILLLKHLPVAVVADADRGYKEDEEYGQRALLEGLLDMAASRREWRVIYFDPSIELLLFRDEALRRALLPVEPTEKQLRRARRKPKRVLAELFAQVGEQNWAQALIRRLEQVDPSVLWATKKLKRLESFLLKRTQAEPVAPTSFGQEGMRVE